MSEQSFEMIAKTFQGLEETLAQELTSLGADEIPVSYTHLDVYKRQATT